MADGVELDAGSGGAVVGTDDISDVHYQIVKQAFGALDSLTLVTTSTPLPVDIRAENASVTVDGTITANLSAVDNAVLDNIDADLTTVIGHVDGIEALLGTIDADTGAMVTDLAAIEVLLTALNGYVDGLEALIGTTNTNTAGLLTDTELRASPIDVTGPLTDTELRANPVVVDLGSNNDVTVTGTVDLGATDNAVLDAIAASVSAIDTDATTIIGHVDGIEGLLGTIDTDTGNIAAGFATEGSALGSGVLLQGDDGTDRTNVLVDTDGHLQVDVLSGGGGGTQYTEGDTDSSITGTAILWEDTSETLATVSAGSPLPVAIISGAGSGGTASDDDADFTAGTTSGTPAMGVYESSPSSVTDGDMGIVGITADRAMRVNVDNEVTVALSATDNGVLDNIDADLTTIIGHVDGLETLVGTTNTTLTTIDGRVDGIEGLLTTIDGRVDGIEALLATIDADTGGILTSVQTLDNAISGSEMQVDVVTLPASTNTIEVVGDVAHDAAASGNPLLLAGVAQTTDDTAPPNRVSAEGDATRLATSLDGAIFAYPHGPQIWSYHVNGSSALTDATVHSSPGAGLSLYVTDIVISSGAGTALNVFFEEGSTTVLGPYYLEAVAGRGLHIQFKTPKKISAATALTVTSSAAIAHAIDVTGFVAPA